MELNTGWKDESELRATEVYPEKSDKWALSSDQDLILKQDKAENSESSLGFIKMSNGDMKRKDLVIKCVLRTLKRYVC